jgi:hypothetical protein
MADPQIAREVDIHITAASGTTLSGTNKLEETSSLSIQGTHTLVARQNLNSDGHTKQSATWHEYGGSLEYKVVRSSTVQGVCTAAAKGGTSVWLHIIHTPDATTGEVKGERYEIYFDNHEETYASAELVGGTASFKVNGAPVDILAA